MREVGSARGALSVVGSRGHAVVSRCEVVGYEGITYTVVPSYAAVWLPPPVVGLVVALIDGWWGPWNLHSDPNSVRFPFLTSTPFHSTG